MLRSLIVGWAVVFSSCASIDAQLQMPINRAGTPGEHHIHFGFLLAYDQARPQVSMTAWDQPSLPDTLANIVAYKRPGFSFGILARWQLSQHVALRSSAVLAFEGFDLVYAFDPGYAPNRRDSFRLSGSYLEFPLNVQLFKRARNNEFGISTGGRYQLHMGSGANGSNLWRRSQYFWEVGVQWNRKLTYFDFMPEIRYSHSMLNTITEPGALGSRIADLRIHHIRLIFNFMG